MRSFRCLLFFLLVVSGVFVVFVENRFCCFPLGDRDVLVFFFFELPTTFESTEDKGARSRRLGVEVVILPLSFGQSHEAFDIVVVFTSLSIKLVPTIKLFCGWSWRCNGRSSKIQKEDKDKKGTRTNFPPFLTRSVPIHNHTIVVRVVCVNRLMVKGCGHNTSGL